MAEKKEEKKEADKATAELTPEEVAAKAKKKKLMVIVIGAVVALSAVGGGAFVFLKGKDHPKTTAEIPKGSEAPAATTTEGETKPPGNDAANKEAAKSDATTAQDKSGDGKGKAGEASKLEIAFGKTMTLPPFHLNLGNPIDNRYVRLEIALEYSSKNPQIEEEVKARMPQLRDAVVSVTRKKSREFLLGPDGTDQLRLELKNRINQYMSKPIDNVYVTDILIE